MLKRKREGGSKGTVTEFDLEHCQFFSDIFVFKKIDMRLPGIHLLGDDGIPNEFLEGDVAL